MNARSGTYQNPVHGSYFADPFVLKEDEAYYAFGTGSTIDGRIFEVLASRDLVSWNSLGGALDPLATEPATDYWAPEVARRDGIYYMYFSAGLGDKNHHLRVATAENPQGPYEHSGHILTPDEPFAIDAHPFCDDGEWYLYYARDFLDGDRIGTGIVVDRLTDMLNLSGEPNTVQRPSAEWHLFDRDRTIYDLTTDWYTVEGPFVRKHHGLYYCFFSGGAWQRPNYGVSYVIGDSPLGPFREPPGNGPAILRTVPDRVIGPGHNSIVQAPNGDDYIVYHAWDANYEARRMCIDKLSWSPAGPSCDGPSFSPRPTPTRVAS